MNLYIFMFSLCAVPLFMLMGIMGSVATRAQLQLTKLPHRWQISLMFYWYVWVVTTSASRDSSYLLHPYQHQWNDNAICMNKIQSFSFVLVVQVQEYLAFFLVLLPSMEQIHSFLDFSSCCPMEHRTPTRTLKHRTSSNWNIHFPR